MILDSLHLPTPNWLGEPHTAFVTIVLLGIWKRFGFTLIIYLAALQAIPLEYYESAQIDGARAWDRLWYITRPLVRPATTLLVILGIIDSFLVFDQVAVMTEGGPVYATEVIGWYMYIQGFQFLKMGYGAAISTVMFLIIALCTIIQWRTTGLGTSEDYQ
jgi:multiple sugar transport system permease protein